MSKTFLTCGSEFSTKLSKLVFTCSDDHFDEKKTFLKIDFFSKFEQFFSRLLAKNILRIWRNCFLSVQTNNLMYNQQLLWKVLLIFSDFGQNFFWNSEFFFLQKCENCFLRTDTNTSSKKSFLKSSLQSFSESDRNILWLSAKNPRRDCQICFLRLQKYVEETDFFNFVFFSLCNRTLSKTFLTCRSEFSTKLSKLVPTCSHDHFDGRKNIFENWFFFEIWANFFPTFGKKYSANLAELLSKRSDEQYDVQPTTSLKTSSSLSGYWSKLFLKFRILVLQNCEKCFLRTDANTSIKKIFFENFSSFFGIGSKHFLILGKNFTERLSELLSTFSKTSWRNRLFQFFFLFLLSNRTLSKTFLTFGKKYSTNLLKLPSTSSDEHCDEKNRFLIFFSFKIWKYFFNLSTIFPQSWQNCFLSVETNSLMKKHFLKNSSSLLFESLSETLSATKFRKAVKTEFYVFRRTLWWKKNNFEIFFSDLEQTFSWILQKKGRKVVKASFYALRRTLWWKNIFLKKFYSFFLSLFENFSDFLTIFFKVDKTAFQVFRSTLWWKIYFFSKTLHKVPFRFWAKQFPTFETIFTKRLSKPFSTWSGNISRKQPLFFLFSLHFRILVKSSLKFRIEFREKWLKLHSTFSDEHFDEKRRFWKWVFFRNFSKTFFWVLTKSIRQIVKTVFQVFKRTLWWKLMFLETFFFLLRNRILGSFLTFVIKVSAKLSNLHFTCSDDHFDEKRSILKVVFFRNLSNFFPDFCQKIFCNVGRRAF